VNFSALHPLQDEFERLLERWAERVDVLELTLPLKERHGLIVFDDRQDCWLDVSCVQAQLAFLTTHLPNVRGSCFVVRICFKWHHFQVRKLHLDSAEYWEELNLEACQLAIRRFSKLSQLRLKSWVTKGDCVERLRRIEGDDVATRWFFGFVHGSGRWEGSVESEVFCLKPAVDWRQKLLHHSQVRHVPRVIRIFCELRIY